MKSLDPPVLHPLSAGRPTQSAASNSSADRTMIGAHAVIHESEWNQRVAERAYFRAEQRGFEPGGELEDWLAAEQEFAQHLVAVRYGLPASLRSVE
jgi:Protein of unknown function (DUF2934)